MWQDIAETIPVTADGDPFTIVVACTGDDISADFNNGAAVLNVTDSTYNNQYYGRILRGSLNGSNVADSIEVRAG